MDLKPTASRPYSNDFSPVLRIALVIIALINGVDAVATDLPWDSMADKIRNSITGPVGWALALIAMTVTGLSLIFARTDMSEIVLRIVQIFFLLSLVFLGGLLIEALYDIDEDDIEAALLPLSLVE